MSLKEPVLVTNINIVEDAGDENNEMFFHRGTIEFYDKKFLIINTQKERYYFNLDHVKHFSFQQE